MHDWRGFLLRRPPLRRLLLLLLLLVIVPLLALLVVKPVRLIAPALVGGLSCNATRSLCVDDPTRRTHAEALYEEGLSYLAGTLARPRAETRIVFCSTERCAAAFGLGARSAVTLGTLGTVIGPRAWQPHYIRHELIHRLQAERLGVLRLLLAPRWFVEGMAYALSDDPRHSLPEPRETWRRRFLEWYASVDKATLWERARAL